jgi:hypothetical protein
VLLTSHALANCLPGSIGRGPVTDIIFEGMPDQGPFPTVKTFHDWLSSLLWRGFPNAQKIADPWRPYLSDDEAITFSHGDLHRANIIISSTGSLPSLIGHKLVGTLPIGNIARHVTPLRVLKNGVTFGSQSS